MLNTIRLRILREVAERGTITAAAEALYLTPPAVSHQLVVLEREVGVPLLERTPRSVHLTEAGRRLVDRGEVILAECEAAVADAQATAATVSGTVRLSVFQTAAQSMALPALVALRGDHPDLEVLTSDLEPVRAVPALKAGQLDIALSSEWDFVPVPADPGIDRHDLLAEQVVALLPIGHTAAGGPVRLRDLRSDDWCVAGETASSRQALHRVARSAGFEPHVVFESNYFRAIGSAVEAGLGVGIMPRMTDLRGLDLAIVPLVEPKLERRIYAAVRKGSGGAPAIRAVLDALAAAAERQSQPA
jgi:DNA-binding transcriptional LysR family regulator